MIRDGKLLLGGETKLSIPEAEWMRLEITCEVGSEPDTRWQLVVAIPGKEPQVFSDLSCPDPKFDKLTWVGFISAATDTTAFYLDNLSLGPSQSKSSNLLGPGRATDFTPLRKPRSRPSPGASGPRIGH